MTKVKPVPRDKGDKKRVPFQIVELLRKGYGNEREFSQSRLQELLAERYGSEVHRDTVSAALKMIDEYFPEVSSQRRWPYVVWSWRDPEPDPVFDASQARYLADGIVTARHVPEKHKSELVQLVLENSDAERLPWDDVLGSLDMASRATAAENPEYFLSVEILAECVQNGWRAAFRFGEIDRAGKFAKTLPDEGEIGPVIPAFLIMSDGTYYLACRFPGSEKIYHYRVDLMHDVREVADAEGTGTAFLNATRYRAEHPLMFSTPEKVTIRVKDEPAARLHFFDRFGGGRVKLTAQDESSLTYEVHADKKAAAILARQFADEMEVLAPQDVRGAVAATAARLSAKYAEAPECGRR